MSDVKDSIKVKGSVEIILKDKDGNTKDTRSFDNLVVTTGLEHIADQLLGTPTQNKISQIGVGTDGTAAAVGQTALLGEVLIQSVDNGYPILGAANNQVKYVSTFAAGSATATLAEAGLFTSDLSEVMVARQVFASIVKGANDILEITWTLSIG